MEEIELKTYHLVFDKEVDMNRFLENGLWLFRNSWLILNKWDMNRWECKMDFTLASIWVQFWGLLLQCHTLEMGSKLALCLEKLRKWGFFFYIPRCNHIRKWINIGNQIDGIYWIDFHYKKFPQCCYFCAKFEHDKEDCDLAAQTNPMVPSKELGPWIEASNPAEGSSKARKSLRQWGSEYTSQHTSRLPTTLEREHHSLTLFLNEFEDNEQDSNSCSLL